MPAFEGVRRPLGVIWRRTRRTFTSQDVQPPAATLVAAAGGPLSCELRPCKVWTCRVARREAGHRDPPQRTEGPAHCGSWVPRHSPSSVSTPFGLCLHRPKGGVTCNKISPETTHRLEIRAPQLAMPAPRVPVLSPHSKSHGAAVRGNAHFRTHTRKSLPFRLCRSGFLRQVSGLRGPQRLWGVRLLAVPGCRDPCPLRLHPHTERLQVCPCPPLAPPHTLAPPAPCGKVSCSYRGSSRQSGTSFCLKTCSLIPSAWPLLPCEGHSRRSGIGMRMSLGTVVTPHTPHMGLLVRGPRYEEETRFPRAGLPQFLLFSLLAKWRGGEHPPARGHLPGCCKSRAASDSEAAGPGGRWESLPPPPTGHSGPHRQCTQCPRQNPATVR